MKDRKMSIRISEKDLQKIRQKAKQSGLIVKIAKYLF